MNPEAREESFVVKSEPIDLPKVKIRVRSAKSLGGKDFNCPSVLQSENGDGSLSDEIIVLDWLLVHWINTIAPMFYR